MNPGFVWGLVAGLAAAALFGVAAVAQAHAVRRQSHRAHGLWDFVRVSVRDPWTLGVVAAYLLGFVLHVVAIWGLPLYLAQATVAMSLPVAAVTSIALREHLRRRTGERSAWSRSGCCCCRSGPASRASCSRRSGSRARSGRASWCSCSRPGSACTGRAR